ncbi:MAG: hypothetical protein EZS28_005528 [Streblomastix strix]|uniref:Protein kinase domain-containing protein n=1 Tax=Streblomastix strix TaxID=222440 RepID=A0A5J4WWM7_9EUKA|nr:MAG: hypothetical protein EZS28_005528 [Streblomastix strix]
MNFEITLRNHGYVPIRLLGKGAFGCVYLVYDYRQDFGNFIIAAKLIAPKNFNQREWETSMDLFKDIKCDNILLHSPPGSGRVYVKISDFGFAKKEDLIHEQTYLAGTLPYMAPEIFKKPLIVTQKVDIFAIEFDPIKRITADKALQHPYFTSPEAIADISPEQQDLALQAIQDELDGDQNITKFDKDSSFIVVESVIKTFLPIETLYEQPEQTIVILKFIFQF